MQLRVLKFLLWLASASHLTLGLSGILSPTLAIAAARFFYGAQLEATPALVHVLRIIGAYMLAVGVLAAVAARDPVRHRPIIVTLAVLLAVRVLQRVVHAEEIRATFQISALRLAFQSAYFALYAAALWLLKPERE
jgi:hypothetical protein